VGDLLRAELLKLRTTRTFFALVASAVGLSLLIVVLITTIDEGFDAQDARDLLTIDASSLFILLLGAIGITGEWRHRTITSSLLAAPDRTRFLVAKLVAYAAAGAVLSVVVTLAVALVSTGILSARDEPTVAFGDFVDVLWRNALVAALLGALGVAVGSLVRNQAGAIVLLLVMAFVIEPTVIGLEPDVGAWLPVNGAPAGINEPPDSEELLSPGIAVLAELGWIAALGAIGALLLRRRDL
jgi:ABC-2 type transport system permease protein